MVGTKIKTAGFMVDFYDLLESMVGGLKTLEEDFDDTLQRLLVKSSGHIMLGKKLEEITLMAEFIKTQDSSVSEEDIKNLLKSIKRKIYECIELLMDQVQKNMIKTVESLAETYDGIVMAEKFNKLLKSLEGLEEVNER